MAAVGVTGNRGVVSSVNGDPGPTVVLTAASVGALSATDPSVTNARTPTAHATTHATGGTDPVTPAAIGAVSTGDARLSDARTPTAHAATHGAAGSDPVSTNLAHITDAGTAASKNTGTASGQIPLLGTNGSLALADVLTALGLVVNPATGTSLGYRSLLTGDTQNRFSVDANGLLTWGPGNAVGDTNLYRSAADTLRTDDALVVGRSFAGTLLTLSNTDAASIGIGMTLGGATNTALRTAISGDTQSRLIVDASGLLTWGPGNAAGDATLSRSGTGVLTLGGALTVTGASTFSGVGAFSSGVDVTRASALSAFRAFISGDTVQRLRIDAAGRHEWGPGGSTAVDTTLYRDAAGRLKTDGTLYAVTGTQTTDFSWERNFTLAFGTAANEKIDIFWPGSNTVNFEITLTPTFSGANSTGVLKLLVGGSGSNTGTIWDISSSVVASQGNVSTHFGFIGPNWDATNTRWRLQIVHRTTTVNTVYAHIKAYAASNSNLATIRDNLGISALYTTDATTAPAPTTMDRQLFVASGTWVNPSPVVPKPVYVRGVCAGNGGGSGRRGAAGTLRTGGGGGAAGIPFEGWTLTTDLTSTVAITVGAGGAGGAAVTTDDTDGNIGTVGGTTSFGSITTYRLAAVNNGAGGGAGKGGTAVGSAAGGASALGAPTGGSSGATGLVGTNGGSNVLTTSIGLYGPSGGGSGGGITTGNAESIGGLGGSWGAGLVLGGTAGAVGGGAGGSGTAGASVTQGGMGGGGGGSSANGTTPGGAGGNGAFPGGAGAGGGASTNGANSGAGGAGADGYCLIVTFL